jgi:hypothetical protein
MRTTVLLALVAACGCAKKPDATGTDRDKGTPAAGDAIEVTAAKLWADYRDDPAAADARYLDKKLRVSGRVRGIETAAGGHGVGIETGPAAAGDGRAKAAVVAECDPRSALGLRDSDEVVVVGHCEGVIDAPGRVGGIKVTLRDAAVVSRTPRK